MNLLRREVASLKAFDTRRLFSTYSNQQQEEQQQQLEQQQHNKQEAQAEQGNITRQNFWRSLERFKAHLHSADFVGFDLELSGVRSIPHLDPLCLGLGSPVHRSYNRIKHLAEKFAVLQVGFSLFHFDPVRNRFLASPYNFYVFPRNDLSLGLPATTLSCDAASLEFLASHGFDFNLCIQDGISYLSKSQEAEARALLANEPPSFRLKSCTCSRSLSNTSEIVFFERLRVDIEKWRNNISACSSGSSIQGRDLAAEFFALSRGQIKDFKVPSYGVLSTCPSITLQLENHQQVCHAQLVVEKHFKDLVVAVRSDCRAGPSHDVKIFFTKSKEHLDIVKSELEQEGEETRMNEAIGFRHVVDAIVASRKPLIGHNCALDLAHIHSKFLSPLPSSVEEFSASLLSNFPLIIDTKCLMSAEPSLRASWGRRHTSLNIIYSHMFKSKDSASGSAGFINGVCEQPNKAHIDIMVGFKRYQETYTKLLHEAGYDAFMTGCIFAQICQQLRVDVKDFVSGINDTPFKYTNLLNFGRGILDLHTGKLREPDGVKEEPDEISVGFAQKELRCAQV